MIVEEFYDSIFYPAFKAYLEANSAYEPIVTKKMPQESKKFPIVPVKLLPSTNTYNNLSYGEETYDFGIEIDIYSTDKTVDNKQVSKRTISEEIVNTAIHYLKENYRFTIKIDRDAPNADSSIHRCNIRLTGKLDTKYGSDKLVIYPR